MQKLIVFLLFFFGFTMSFLAQPIPDAIDYSKGCHHAWGSHDVKPLTKKQEKELAVSAERSDTIDIINYDLLLDFTDFSNKQIEGLAIISFKTILPTSSMRLNLLGFEVTGVQVDGVNVTYNHDGLIVAVTFPNEIPAGEEHWVKVTYNGKPTVDPTGFGGLDFRDGIAYNLGIGLGSNPYNMGRGWYPCFDNFVERATYYFAVISELPRRGYCTGTFLEEIDQGDGKVNRRYHLDQLLPTYLAGIAVGEFAEVTGVHDGFYGPRPTQLLASPENIAAVEASFAELGGTIDALEYWFGPYVWERVGYVTTAVGAMEHPNQIAYPTSVATSGATLGQRRLMAHELAHCWWGNVAGIPGTQDMWFKEGNAEYGSHLTTEYLDGREAMVEQVKSNHLDVITSAHLDDGAFLQLSGIPFENTYGTHTYNKGASMIHNLRGYLGDSLFRSAMTSVQQNFAYQSVTAEEFRIHLEEKSGIDLNPFFDNWLKSPGWSGFAVESFTSQSGIAGYTVTVDMVQGLRAAPEFHTNVPLELTVYDELGNSEIFPIMMSGEEMTFELLSSFDPKFILVNEPHKLNLAQFQNRGVRDTDGGFISSGTYLNMQASDLSGPIDLIVDHYWFGPKSLNSDDARISSRRYWSIDGFFPDDYTLAAQLQYRGKNDEDFEFDLVSETEDSLILVYRKDASEPWTEYPDYSKNTIGSTTDAFGLLIIDQIIPGDYALANGVLPLTSARDLELTPALLYPNPTSGIFVFQTEALDRGNYQMEFTNSLGQLVEQRLISHFGGTFQEAISTAQLTKGNYQVSLRDGQGVVKASETLVVQ